MQTQSRRLAMAERRITLMGFWLQQQMHRYGFTAAALTLAVLIAASWILASSLQTATAAYFNPARFAVLRNLFESAGGALIGATAIGFSVVMIAVQLNFARMPHGLFRKLSSDVRLLGAFAATFLLALCVSALALVPNADWSAIALIWAGWATVLILTLFFYGYRRALALINPDFQLGLIVADARRNLRRWAGRAQRMAPLFEEPKKEEDDDHSWSKHDLARVAFFRLNPQWTEVARRAVTHAMSFARRYSEQGDYEVTRSALNAIIMTNGLYVLAKGRTFFAHNLVFDIPQANDAFINDTLEQLRQFAQAATSRGDEEALRQVFRTFAALVQTYADIDYSLQYNETKEHSHLAASYLASAVQAVVPRGMTDVVMEGVRLIGTSAQVFLAVGDPNGVVSPAERIATFAGAGALKPELRAVTLSGMEQLALLAFGLLRTSADNIDFAIKQVRANVELVVQLFLNVPDMPLSSVHSNYLAPYYSLAKTQTLGDWLTQLCNSVLNAKRDDVDAQRVLAHIESWSEELYKTEKALLLLAIKKKSHFAFDLIHWIAHVTKLLSALAHAPVADGNDRKILEEHASWLISVVSWVPDNKEAIGLLENFSTTDTLFDVALETFGQGSLEVAESARNVLADWTFKAGHHLTGWGTLEKGLLALATLALWQEDLQAAQWLKAEIIERLGALGASDPELLDRAARGLRQKAASLRPRPFEIDRIERALAQIERPKMENLLKEIADLLSPGTANEPVTPDYI